MSEDRFIDLLGPYVLGELTDEEARELKRHLESCSSCRNDLEVVHHAHGMLRSAAAGPPPELKEWVLARARSERRHPPAGRWKFWLPVAAAVLVVAIVGFGVLQNLTGPSDGLALTATGAAPLGRRGASGGASRGQPQGRA